MKILEFFIDLWALFQKYLWTYETTLFNEGAPMLKRDRLG